MSTFTSEAIYNRNRKLISVDLISFNLTLFTHPPTELWVIVQNLVNVSPKLMSTDPSVFNFSKSHILVNDFHSDSL